MNFNIFISMDLNEIYFQTKYIINEMVNLKKILW